MLPEAAGITTAPDGFVASSGGSGKAGPAATACSAGMEPGTPVAAGTTQQPAMYGNGMGSAAAPDARLQLRQLAQEGGSWQGSGGAPARPSPAGCRDSSAQSAQSAQQAGHVALEVEDSFHKWMRETSGAGLELHLPRQAGIGGRMNAGKP